jgi:methylmalonyl-CoA mutase N-terminal domain/subunit
VESEERIIVGVNEYREEEAGLRIEQPDYGALEAAQKARVAQVRSNRDGDGVARGLNAVRQAARSGDNLLPPLVAATKAMTTLGEIADVLREEWGEYRHT